MVMASRRVWEQLRHLSTGPRASADCRPLLRRLSRRGRSRADVARSVRSVFEALEVRQLLSTIPAPSVISQFNVAGPANNGIDASAPAIAIDPLDPRRMVTAYTTVGDRTNTNQTSFVHLAYSTNGGQSWATQPIPGNLPDPASTANAGQDLYPVASDVNVAFDRNHDFYLVYDQHSDNYARGSIVLSEWDLSGGNPQTTGLPQDFAVYTWNGADGAISPSFVIDNNLPTYTDPDTGVTVTDPTSGNLYLAWSTNLLNATNRGYQVRNFNPNAIAMMIANPADAINNNGIIEPRFSSPMLVNTNGYVGVERDAHPRLAVSQGDAAGNISPGQVTVIWDDWNTLGPARVSNANNQYDIINATSLFPGATATVEDLTAQDIPDATKGVSPAPDTPGVLTATLNVNITNPNFTVATLLQNLTVSIAMTHPDLAQISIDLVAPDGTTVRLVNNRTDGSGASATGVGISGASMGVLNGQSYFTTFDDNAVRPIDDTSATAPFIGAFQADQSMAQTLGPVSLMSAFKGFTLNGTAGKKTINGTWSLVITDYRNGPAATATSPQPQLLGWKLGFNGLAAPTQVQVAQTTVLGPTSATAPDQFPRGTNLTPTGIGAGAVIASDNTLGSFSPHQGTLYVAYVNALRGSSNPGDNTDVYVCTSTDGGINWSSGIRVNDDLAQSDGYSESNGSNAGRAQFLPALSVDQYTGTVGVIFRDARNDASRDRVATYFSASIDGGRTWSRNVYLNAPNAATDALSGKTVNLGPIPDNQSSGNPKAEKTYGYGNQQGLVMAAGQVFGVWSGNLNGGDRDANWNLGILGAGTQITAGPRVISSTMGQVSLPGDALNPANNNSPVLQYFEVQFDRPVDPATIIANGAGKNVFLAYRTPGTSGDVPGADVPLSATVTALDPSPYGATRFRFALATPATAVGTYSYHLMPTVADRVRNPVPLTYGQAVQTFVADPSTLPMTIPAVGTGGSGIPAQDQVSSTIQITGFPDTQPINALRLSLRLDHTSDADLKITLTSPAGTSVVLCNASSASGRNFGSGTGSSIQYTIFDDAAPGDLTSASGPYVGSVLPDNPLSAFAGETLNGTWTLTIEDTQGAAPPVLDTGVLFSWTLTADTTVPTAGTGNQMDQNADGSPGQMPVTRDNPSPTLGDLYATPMPTLASAWDGSTLHTPYTTDTLPLIIAGPHVLAGRTYQAQGASTNVPLVDAPVPPANPVLTPGITTSTITIAGDASAQIDKIVVSVDITHAAVQGLTLTLISPSGKRVILAQNRPNSPVDQPDFTGTVFDDNGSVSIASGSAPFQGSWKPEQPLSVLAGDSLSGTWTLEIADSVPGHNGAAPLLNSWSITAFSTPVVQQAGGTDNIHVTFDRDMNPASFTPASIVRLSGPNGLISGPFTVTADPNFDPNYPDPDPAHPRTFKISFPRQTVSGSYSLLLASDIRSAAGDMMDAGLNAGVDALRGIAPASVTLTYGQSTATLITADPSGTSVSTSTIVIPDSYTVQGLTVRLNLSYAHDPDLTAVLISPSGTRITLFSGVGSGPLAANFTNTLLDDFATTPIQLARAPFFGRFNPQDALSTLFGSENVHGTWTLEITNSSTSGTTGQITSWSLQVAKPVSGSGLGEDNADRTTLAFRIFDLGLLNPASTTTWTSVTSSGPITQTGLAAAGRVTSVAIDPADPSGNTVFVTTPAGGVWKTTNFLTTDPKGPTYFPLTYFGPAASLHVASIALVARNNDPTQTIVYAVTGDADLGTPGVGILRSMDGGATWTLLDSLANFTPAGAPIPTASRTHDFIGQVGYKIVADPTPTPTGQYILYAAFSGTRGGVYRSTDTGRTWSLSLAGNATDVILDNNSGPKDAFGNPIGNLQNLYAGVAGQGIFLSANRGQSWSKLTPLGFDGSVRPTGPNPPGLSLEDVPDPNANALGRIVLAMPDPTGTNSYADILRQGWLYAAVVTTAPVAGARSGTVGGLYMTKDFGANWTKVDTNRLAAMTTFGFVPTNSNGTNAADFTMSSGGSYNEGNYALTLAVDPLNPNVVYFGGSGYGTQAGSSIIRIDTTALSDAHAFFMRNDGDTNVLRASNSNTDTVTLKTWTSRIEATNPIDTPFINLINNPGSGLLPSSTYYMGNVATITNSGEGARWIRLDGLLGLPSTNGMISPVHNVITSVDPITGKTRLIVSTDSGIYSVVYDDYGRASSGVGNSVAVAGGRSGDLAVNELVYGASQPSVGTGLANEIAGALFYAMSSTTGLSYSDPNILSNGHTAVTFPYNSTLPGAVPAAGGGVATDQTGSGSVFFTLDPALAQAYSDFFFADYIGQTTGLFLGNNSGSPTQDPQWPSFFAPNIAVNPINPDQIAMSSNAGRIYATVNRGQTWFVIGEPSAARIPGTSLPILDGTYAPALAFGAPDPGATNLGNDATNLRVYVGTTGGHIYVTVDGGGANANGWRDITGGTFGATGALDGSPVHMILASPARGSHALYAVTDKGVYYLPDSTAPVITWTPISGNLFAITRQPFGNPDLVEPVLSAHGLTSIAADWRYQIPDGKGGTFPVLYAAGDAAVFRSLNNGATWSLFPDLATDGAAANGGFLPSVKSVDLDLVLGNVDPNTGYTKVATGPSVLLLSTDGLGQFAIRIAPLLFNTRFGPNDGSGNRTIIGQSQIGTTSKNNVTNPADQSLQFLVYDASDPNNLVPVAPGTVKYVSQNADGTFTVAVDSSFSGTALAIAAKDAAGVVGPTVTLAVPPSAPAAPNLVNADDTGASNTDNITSVRKPRIDNAGNLLAPGVPVALYVDGVKVDTQTTDGTGYYLFTLSGALADGTHQVTVTQTNRGLTSPQSPALALTIDGTGPTGTGIAVAGITSGDALTTVNLATISDPHDVLSASINWGDGTTSAGTLVPTGTPNRYTVQGSHTYAGAGTFTIKVTGIDSLGNTSANPIQTSVNVAVPQYAFGLTAQSQSVSEGSVFNGTVAIVTDSNSKHSTSSLSATIDWGDGTTTAGSIVPDTTGAGRFAVLGMHTYTDNSQGKPSYAVRVLAGTVDGKTATANSTLSVANVAPTPTISGPASVFVGDTATYALAATDSSSADTAAGFTYTVDWGDGTYDTLTGNGSGVNVNHTFAAASSRIMVTATDKDGGSQTAAPYAIYGSNLPVMRAPAVSAARDVITFTVDNTQILGGLSISDLRLYHNGDASTPMPLDGAQFAFDPASGAGSLDLRGLTKPLPEGDYQLQIKAGPKLFVVGFAKLTGDVNGDAKVDTKDEALVKQSLGKLPGQPGYNAAADLNGDGAVNNTDLAILRANKNRKASQGITTVLLQTGSAAKAATLNFGTLKRNTNGGYIDLVIRNNNRNGVAMNIGKLTLANPNFNFALQDQPWGTPASTVSVIPAGGKLTVRVYLKAVSRPQTIKASFGFFFSTSAQKDYRDVVVPITAVVTK